MGGIFGDQSQPQAPKIQSKPVQLQKQERKIDIGGADLDVKGDSLKMKRKGKKATRTVNPAKGVGLSM